MRTCSKNIDNYQLGEKKHTTFIIIFYKPSFGQNWIFKRKRKKRKNAKCDLHFNSKKGNIPRIVTFILFTPNDRVKIYPSISRLTYVADDNCRRQLMSRKRLKRSRYSAHVIAQCNYVLSCERVVTD